MLGALDVLQYRSRVEETLILPTVEVPANVGSIADGTKADDAGDAGGCRIPSIAGRPSGVCSRQRWAVVPRLALIEPQYPKAPEDGGGLLPVGLERMLRIHFL
jgi:hypothetical protein